MIAHPFGVAGLLVDAAGSIGLLRFTAVLDAGAPRPYAKHLRVYRLSFLALTLGFVLQLIDMIVT